MGATTYQQRLRDLPLLRERRAVRIAALAGAAVTGFSLSLAAFLSGIAAFTIPSFIALTLLTVTSFAAIAYFPYHVITRLCWMLAQQHGYSTRVAFGVIGAAMGIGIAALPVVVLLAFLTLIGAGTWLPAIAGSPVAWICLLLLGGPGGAASGVAYHRMMASVRPDLPSHMSSVHKTAEGG